MFIRCPVWIDLEIVRANQNEASLFLQNCLIAIDFIRRSFYIPFYVRHHMKYLPWPSAGLKFESRAH